ncbi:hypothetical protein AAVH_22397 [Aphelenchoides avenae]|nr:hypothetical protein AAVH_22397 [Aphelenchus avenae]
MSERPDKSVAAFEDLVERMKAASDDAVLLREIVESSDSASIAAAFARLFAGGGFSAPNESKLQEKPRNRPCPRTPNETFTDILHFLDRDTLDAVQLTFRFLLEFIGDREASGLPLRSLSQVKIGCFERQLEKLAHRD